MFKKLEIDFEHKQQEILQQRKSTLKQLREFKRVVDRSEISQHSTSYKQLKD